MNDAEKFGKIREVFLAIERRCWDMNGEPTLMFSPQTEMSDNEWDELWELVTGRKSYDLVPPDKIGGTP